MAKRPKPDPATEQEREEKLQQGMQAVILELERLLAEQISARVNIETRWMEDLRQLHGIYEPNIQGALENDSERSKVFVNLTRPKTLAWEARLTDLLFPADDRNWGIQPTPVPDLDDAARNAVAQIEQAEVQIKELVEQNNAMADQQADPEQADPDAARQQEVAAQMAELEKQLVPLKKAFADAQRILDQAKRRAELMQREIDDQLTETNYAAVARDVIGDACRLGSGIIKGPVTMRAKRGSWQPVVGEDGAPIAGQYVLERAPDPRPGCRRVHPINWFPDMSAACMEECEFTFERHPVNKMRLRKMTREMGFRENVVREILRDSPRHESAISNNNLNDMRLIEMDAPNAALLPDRYIVWEYHGALSVEQIATVLRAIGKDDEAEEIEREDDTLAERRVVLYFCQGRLLKIAPDYPLDSGESLYSWFPFERGEATMLAAIGVPRLMRQVQSMFNSSIRMMMDNGGLSAGPQIIVDKSQVEPEDGNWKLRPRKVWIRKGSDVSPQGQGPFQVVNIPVNLQQLMVIVDFALKMIDEVVSMPLIAQGEQGAHVTQTSSGMSMLFNSANVIFRRVVKNWDDDITSPFITRFFDWNMQFSDKEAIKGDMQTEARGTSVLLVREIQSQQLMAITDKWSTHPVIGPAIRVYETLRMTLQAMAINPGDVLVEPDEFEARVKQMAESQPQSPEEIRAAAQIEVATITAETRRSEGELQREIAEMNRQTEILKLIQKDGVDMAKVQAMLDSMKMRTDSDERKLAAEIAVEDRNAARAEAMGREPTGSGGAISAGTVAA
ncbi:hypothetical protein [Sphingopyxis flava]|uniref:Portal protein n=1 Tax=Sphingopyxis flava TaxID=1507287 RepID=A0A1T5ACG0_9SPHN|nr:hypothetical protein [Sphingopyxis flava]SKB32447.1 hypothetical protein SAMN06295937_100380 [Sphingopyxis flava]